MTIQFALADLGVIRTRYIHASGDGPPLVLLHGITGMCEHYTPELVEPLTTLTHVYAPDLRGHGYATHVPDAYHVRDYATDVRALIEGVIGEPAIVVGHSLGGLVALHVAADAPALVRGVFLEDPPVYSTSPERMVGNPRQEQFVQTRRALVAFAERDAAVADVAAQMGGGTLQRGVQYRLLDPDVLTPAIEGRLWEGSDREAVLAAVRCPVRLLAGEPAFGGELTDDDLARFRAAVPHATTRVLKGAGHGLRAEQPDTYRDELTAFLRTFAA